jgi:hypothetical protein
MGQELVLDPELRVWVFIPLTLCIVFMKLIQQHAHTLMFGAGPDLSQKDTKEQREANAVARSQRLRQFWRFIPETSFKMRKNYFIAEETGLFHQKIHSKSMQETMSTDPTVMVDMMKRNISGMAPQFIMGWVVNFFFSGFVMGKIPFALSPRFKPMLQRGIDLASLDVTYFTSLSYYILLLFGLRGAFSLIFREETLDDSEMMKRQMNPMANNATFDAKTAFAGEVQALKTLEHDWELDTAEEKAVEVLQSLIRMPKI